MNVSKLGTIFSVIAIISGCQTAPAPNSPEALKKAEYERLETASAVANCKLIVQLDKKRTAQNKETSPYTRCHSILANNSIKGGGIHPANFVPDLAINGIPIPLGGMMKLAVALDQKDRESKAGNANLPAWADKNEGTRLTYQVLLFQKFTPEEIEPLKASADFSDAARKNQEAFNFKKANPGIASSAS